MNRLLTSAIAVALLASGCTSTGDTVTAREVRLVNEAGETRAVLSVEEDLPHLRFYDNQGQVRASLKLDAGGAGLVLMDESGNPGASLGLNESFSTLALGGRGNVRALLTVDTSGRPELRFRDSTGHTTWSAPQ